MAWTVYVVQDDRAANLARVVDDDVAKSHQPLRDAGGDGHVLNFAQRYVLGGAGDQASIDLELRIRDRITNHVAPHVVIGWNQQQRQGEWNRDRRRNAKRR